LRKFRAARTRITSVVVGDDVHACNTGSELNQRSDGGGRCNVLRLRRVECPVLSANRRDRFWADCSSSSDSTEPLIDAKLPCTATFGPED